MCVEEEEVHDNNYEDVERGKNGKKNECYVNFYIKKTTHIKTTRPS